MTPMDLPPTISVEQAGTILGVSRRAAYRAVHRGELPAVRIGRRLLVPSAKLLALLGLDQTETAFSTADEPGAPSRP